MKNKILLRTLAILAILACTIGCDQVSKNIVRRHISLHEQITFMYNHITLTKVENKGAFLSLGDTLPKSVNTLLLTILPMFALIAGFIFLMTKINLSKLTILGISLAVGGGFGNIYDRWVYGSVTDFVHIDFWIFQTGIFNMADVSIMTGMILIMYENYFSKKTEIEKY